MTIFETDAISHRADLQRDKMTHMRIFWLLDDGRSAPRFCFPFAGHLFAVCARSAFPIFGFPSISLHNVTLYSVFSSAMRSPVRRNPVHVRCAPGFKSSKGNFCSNLFSFTYNFDLPWAAKLAFAEVGRVLYDVSAGAEYITAHINKNLFFAG